MMIKRQIPNIITLCNLLCGVLAILIFSNGTITASYLILAGAVFDFFDGLVARWLKVESKIGKELDSLADVVTFGVAPAFIAMQLLQNTMQDKLFEITLCSLFFLSYSPLIMIASSAYRLAKFNIDTRQSTSFLGVPTPLNALLWLSIPIIADLALKKQHFWGWYNEVFYRFVADILTNQWFIIAGAVAMSVLMIVEIPMLALKFKNLKWKENRNKFIFIVISLLLFMVINLYAIPFIVILYILISIISKIITK